MLTLVPPTSAFDQRTRRLAVAAASGVLSWAWWLAPQGLLDLGIEWAPGLIFGLLVLAPAAGSRWRAAVLVVESVLVYRAAVWVAVQLIGGRAWSETAACAVVGAVAVPVLALVTTPVLGCRWKPAATALATLAGAVGGVLLGLGVATSEQYVVRLHMLVLAGFALWQTGYAAGHLLRGATENPG